MFRNYGIIALICLTFFTNKGVQSFDLTFGDITEVLHFAREAVTGGLETLEWIRKANPEDHEYDFPFIKKMERRLMNQISITAKKIDVYQERMELKHDEALEKILKNLPLSNRLDRSLHELKNLLSRIDDLFSDFLAYNISAKYQRYTTEEFAKNCISSASGALPDLLQTIHRLLVPGQYDNYDNSLLVLLAQSTAEATRQICNEKQSPQQMLYNLYNTIVFTEMKGFAMMQFSYNLLRLYNNVTFIEETERTKEKYLERISETLTTVKIAMSHAPRELWRCDPSIHIEGSTYTELKQLLQGYIVNEVDLNPTSTCKNNCATYSLASVHGCYANQYCAQQRRCNGNVVNCQYIDSDMWICPSAKGSDRRYDYIQYENRLVYGNKETCKKPTTKVDSWWRWLFWHCSYCMCFCDDHNSSSDRYFSLREVTSDATENWVVTGIKLEKVNKIVHLVIQQGQLLKRAGINETTVHWKKIDNFTVLDSNVENGRDYYTLAWEQRAIDLDDLVSMDNEVLTGVRFRVVGVHLNFEIRVTPFNFTSGKLIKPLEKSRWMSNDNTDVKDSSATEKARTELKLDKPGIPTIIRAPSLPDSRSNQYLNFGPTDLEKDVGQTTIPYLDIQPVITIPPFPLSGAGIYHKGRKGSGGFVAPRIITYDFEKHLQADLPPSATVHGINDIPVL
ncbi:uncharacterized protein orion isoform X1 [Venturia canescens]|uniref:uncharacterized protein orion isoform X1 n=1 Tax=Venturia canescens TaxID=32260 RepID=UPI001C9CCCDF|nr:uncharacterized protein LOC122409054 isoform X1 [Venturia canescens]